MKKTPTSLALVAASAAAVTAAPAVAEPGAGGCFVRLPDGTLLRDPDQPMLEDRKPREARMAPDAPEAPQAFEPAADSTAHADGAATPQDSA